ncbi:hypothetical protein BDW59DRAFT_164699 [Aspergillus cavernicola]|uniref:Uncharacterized protein n=1 Tax=Aspergillus cavernicola TaxID=176166 RepID=A0ABR4HZM7_9EURO
MSSLAHTSRCESWEEAKEHAEALRFAATITKTANIHGFTIATRLVGREIILRFWFEKQNLVAPMTISSITPSIHEWFLLRGITTTQGIEQFERLGGSLARGAFLLLCILPRRKSGRVKHHYRNQDLSKSAGVRVFDDETTRKGKALLAQFTGTDPIVPYTEDSNMPKALANTSSSSILGQEKETTHPGDAFSSEDLDELSRNLRACSKYFEELSLPETGFHFSTPNPSYKLSEQEDEERHNLLRGKFFKGHVYKKLDTHHRIWALKYMLTVRFSYLDVNLDEGFVLKVLMSPPGSHHPHAYATQARNDDPASCIAVQITGIQNNGNKFTLYAQQLEDGWKEPMRLNAVFDWLSGATVEQIAVINEARRYICQSKGLLEISCRATLKVL